MHTYTHQILMGSFINSSQMRKINGLYVLAALPFHFNSLFYYFTFILFLRWLSLFFLLFSLFLNF